MSNSAKHLRVGSQITRQSLSKRARESTKAIVSIRRFSAGKVVARGVILYAIFIFFFLSTSAQTQQPPSEQDRQTQPQPAFPDLPSGPGREMLIKICSSCHSPDNVVTHGQSREDWEMTLAKMAAYGMNATNDQLSETLDYLAKNFSKPPDPKINVNKATAVEIELALGLSAKEAKSIVEYRVKNGDFRSVDDLKKVPDIDSKKLTEKKDRLTF
jgi:competence protein ComEA